MTKFIILALLLSILHKHCLGDDSSNEAQAQLALANNKFAFDLINKLSYETENQFFSPVGIMAAFTMLSLGAKGNTLREIDSVFHLDELKKQTSDPMAVHQSMKKILEAYGKQNVNYSLSLASSLFAQKDYEIKQTFLDEVKKYYEATVENVDFGSGTAEGIINKWVESKTNNKIKDLFPPRSLPSLTRLVLANAIYFKGDWNSPFAEILTTDEDFHVADGKTKKVKMMKKLEKFQYITDSALNAQLIALPYSGNHLSMVVVLPDKEAGLSKVLPKITAESLKYAISNMRSVKVNLQLPKFKLETQYSLADILEQLGIKDLFTSRADLSDISESQSLSVSKIAHKAYIDVYEKGTEAAAASGIAVPLSPSLPELIIDFKVDQPFIFALVDHRFDNEILFAGTVLKPADLSGMNDEPSLEVSRVIHKAYVDVNEEGTEAAAATGIVVEVTSILIEEIVQFNVNRHFAFAIVDKRFNNEILFFGTVSKL